MKFYDNSRKMNISLFVLISFMLANYNSILAAEMDKDNYNNYNQMEYTAGSFLSLEETKKEMSEDMQYQNLFDLKAQFVSINLEMNVNTFDPNGPFLNLELNSIRMDNPFEIKLIFMPLQKIQTIKVPEIIIFEKFEVLFDNNILHKNIFGIKDIEKSNKIMEILDKLRMRFGIGYENCRYLFTNDLFGMKNINIQKTTINHFNQLEALNNIYSVNMNIFCFNSVDKAISFNSLFAKNYDSFLDSMRANNLFFYNKHLINNLRIIFKSILLSTNNFPNSGSAEVLASIESNNALGVRQLNPFSAIDGTNIKFAFLHFSKDGVLLSEEGGNKMENILVSFGYNSIRDCVVETVPQQRVLPKEMYMTGNNKCCIKMKVDMKDVFDNVVYVCSFRHSGYQCNLEAKFLQESLMQKCSLKLNLNIGYAFEKNINMSTYIMGFSSFSNTYVFAKIYEFITAKIKEMKLMPLDRRAITENKLVKMIQELGESFKTFLQVNSTVDISKILLKASNGILTIPVPTPPLIPSQAVIVEGNGEINIPSPLAPAIPGIITEVPGLPGTIEIHQHGLIPGSAIISPASVGGIFKLCENHPRMKDCICAAYPNSSVCKKDYCLNHPNYYECAPNYCNIRPDDHEACKCKYDPSGLECRCKLNPISRECFCMRFPEAKYCLPEFCSSFNNFNQVFCLCAKNPVAQECRPGYCFENKFDVRCRCLMNPQDKACLCYTYPGNLNCKGFNYELNKFNNEKEDDKDAKKKKNKEADKEKEKKGKEDKKKTEKKDKDSDDLEVKLSGDIDDLLKKSEKTKEKEEEKEKDLVNKSKKENKGKSKSKDKSKASAKDESGDDNKKKSKTSEEDQKSKNDKKNKQSDSESEEKEEEEEKEKSKDSSEKSDESSKDETDDSEFEQNAPKIKPYVKKAKKSASAAHQKEEKNDKKNSDESEDDDEEEKSGDSKSAKEFLIKDNTSKKTLSRLNTEESSDEANFSKKANDKMKHKLLKTRKEFEENLNAKKNFNHKSASDSNEEEGYFMMRNYHNKRRESENAAFVDQHESKNNLVKIRNKLRISNEENDSENKPKSNKTNKNDENNKRTCNEMDIFCQCKDHPRYRPCVCLAFPNAEICVKNYCKEDKNKLSYECNPKSNCQSKLSLKNENCKCKDNFDSLCACKLNPLSKECFCRKYPVSHLCNSQNCSFEKESIFCKCDDPKEKKTNKVCQDYYCRLNPNAPQCFCLVNPEENYCKCLNDPAKCEKKEIMQSITAFKNHLNQVNMMKNININ